MQNILVTGAAGFIGTSLCHALIERKYQVIGIDNYDPFYPIAIKEKNITDLEKSSHFSFFKGDIRNRAFLKSLPEFDIVFHLAAKAGVRPSISHPEEYLDVNTIGMTNLLNESQHRQIEKFIFSSSSSVYGINNEIPWKESNHNLAPISPYAVSKIAGEQLGKMYQNNYDLPFYAMRLFTVYGPRQRPDLAIHKFTDLILHNKPIEIYGDGSTKRDYTYISDIVEGLLSVLDYKGSSFDIFNLGNNQLVSLKTLVETLQETIGIKATIVYKDEQPGDVSVTYADISKAQKKLGYQPKTQLREGLANFYEWYQNKLIN